MPGVTLTPADDRQTREVSLGEPITLRLPENPSTGYTWKIEPDDGLNVRSDAYTAEPPGIIGGGGTHSFQLEATRPGTFRLRALLRQEWLGDSSAIEQHEFILNVR
jgi:inhibitor of cysteine peptidase